MSFSLSFSSFPSFFFIFLFPFLFPFPFSFFLSNAWLVRQMSSEKIRWRALSIQHGTILSIQPTSPPLVRRSSLSLSY
jgi:hypothetical protein